MNILLIGQGGREHAIAWKLAQSPQCETLYIAPGNAGTAEVGVNVTLDVTDFEAVYEMITEKEILLVIIGPEQPLVDGLADFLRGINIAVIGPGREGAQLEGSKEFSKAFMERHNINTARFQTFQSWEEGFAKEYVRSYPLPVVIKASGLAAGKGVVICETYEEADETIEGMLSGGWFGLSGKTIIVEQFLKGIEMSVFALSDGKTYKLLPNAKDYKKIGEGDTGPNTGGMGAVSPVPFADIRLMDKITEKIIEPTFQGLVHDDIPYCGFLFFGIMVSEGEPYLLEYNCRMGDPESEVVFPRLENDLVELLLAADSVNLHNQTIKVKEEACCTVMLASQGYPDQYEKGKVISGIHDTKDVMIFHAGTKESDGNILTNGGRVLAISALGKTLNEALEKSYRAASVIEYEGKYYRKDIGKDVL